MKSNLKRRQQVLDLLYQNQDTYFSGEELSNKLGVSRTTIWKYIKYLRKAGYKIESSSKVGYRLVSAADKLLPEEIKRNLKANILGQEVIYYEKINSTNKIAKEKADSGAKEGTIIIAEEQLEGKGRLDRSFISPSGGIWMSCILRPDLKPVLATRVTYIISLALAKTINKLTKLEAKIKWPNDILIGDKKVSGILTKIGAELDRIDYLIIGMGINLNFSVIDLPQELNNKVTTIYDEIGEKVNRVEFVQEILLAIEQEYQRLQDFDSILSDWKELSYTLGQEVRVKGKKKEIIGTAIDIASDGALIINSEDEKTKVYSGDVSLYHQEFDSGN